MNLKKTLTFDEQLDKLIAHGNEYKSDIDLELIGFPENYLEIMKNSL